MFYFVTSSDFNVFSSFESLRPPEKTATLTWSCCRPQESLAEPPQPLFLWCNFLLSCWRAVSWDLNTNLLVLLSAEPERTPHCSECVCVCVHCQSFDAALLCGEKPWIVCSSPNTAFTIRVCASWALEISEHVHYIHLALSWNGPLLLLCQWNLFKYTSSQKFGITIFFMFLKSLLCSRLLFLIKI